MLPLRGLKGEREREREREREGGRESEKHYSVKDAGDSLTSTDYISLGSY